MFDDESSDEEGVNEDLEEELEMGADGSKPKREHQLKHWGKKNRKLKAKNPYAEENGKVAYQAFSTNRGVGPKDSARKSSMKTTRAVYSSSGARETTGGGTTFTRQSLPHHSST